ncbi:short-chain collagen C4-like [Mytilus californianus]|uniref:short-chain collagen C4-like n=1 Tax=Mytilus californianus TaxID=6549 RepID=UPI002245F111|nr:short-chain collagen C4-like [Mytilus californianus]
MLKISLIVLLSCVCCRAGKPGCLKEHLIKEIERNLKDLQSIHVHNGENSGETYIRWGKTSCPKESNLVYDGYAAGKHFNIGGSGANFLCLPKNPEWNSYKDGVNTWRGKIYGIEYEVGQKPYPSTFHDKDMPCAVCQSKRSTVLMVPGKLTCHDGWHKEFSGYLMSQSSTNGRTPAEYICVDEKLESVPGGDSGRNEAVVYPVEVVCGSLKCPPYVNGRELTCVVCSN